VQFLNDLWLALVPYLYPIGHYAMTSSNYLILAATFERYLIETRKQTLANYVRAHRSYICFFAIFAAGVMKVPVFFELTVSQLRLNDVNTTQVVQNGGCTGLTARIPYPTTLSLDENYTWFKLHIRQTVCIVLPFLGICYFNAFIVRNIRRIQRRARFFRAHTAGQVCKCVHVTNDNRIALLT
jgi:hypothetical protein